MAAWLVCLRMHSFLTSLELFSSLRLLFSPSIFIHPSSSLFRSEKCYSFECALGNNRKESCNINRVWTVHRWIRRKIEAACFLRRINFPTIALETTFPMVYCISLNSKAERQGSRWRPTFIAWRSAGFDDHRRTVRCAANPTMFCPFLQEPNSRDCSFRRS